jgi:non-haem Fe2+, alpha-ketoglutarate-dependent halogenase
MLGTISPEQIQQYQDEGYLFPIQVFSSEEVDHFKSEFEKTKTLVGENVTPHDLRQPQIHFRWAYEIATHPKILDVIEDLIGPDILVSRGSIFFKDPGPGYYTFHADAYPLGISDEHAGKFASVWIALTESNEENGCMQVIPRTHLAKIEHTETLFAEEHNQNSAVSRGLTVMMDLERAEKVSLVLQPGQMSVHHANLVHGSGPNRTNQSRIGIVMRYMAPQVKENAKLNHPVIVARGSDAYGYNDHLGDPPKGSLEDGLRAMAAFVAGHPEGYIYQKQSSLLKAGVN